MLEPGAKRALSDNGSYGRLLEHAIEPLAEELLVSGLAMTDKKIH